MGKKTRNVWGLEDFSFSPDVLIITSASILEVSFLGPCLVTNSLSFMDPKEKWLTQRGTIQQEMSYKVMKGLEEPRKNNEAVRD